MSNTLSGAPLREELRVRLELLKARMATGRQWLVRRTSADRSRPSIGLGATVIAGLIFCSPAVLAWDGVAVGKISQIDSVTEPGNFETRIYVAGQSVICQAGAGGDTSFAYMNSADANYKGTLATLLMAYAMSKNVTIYTLNEGGKFCHIHYVVMN